MLGSGMCLLFHGPLSLIWSAVIKADAKSGPESGHLRDDCGTASEVMYVIYGFSARVPEGMRGRILITICWSGDSHGRTRAQTSYL